MIIIDPSADSPLVAAVAWVQSALLGTISTSIAAICVAAVGLAMLSGRVQLRRGVHVVIGCFVLFGAPLVAAGLRDLASTGGEQSTLADQPPPAPPTTPIAAAPPVSYDPYAGASVPTTR